MSYDYSPYVSIVVQSTKRATTPAHGVSLFGSRLRHAASSSRQSSHPLGCSLEQSDKRKFGALAILILAALIGERVEMECERHTRRPRRRHALECLHIGKLDGALVCIK